MFVKIGPYIINKSTISHIKGFQSAVNNKFILRIYKLDKTELDVEYQNNDDLTTALNNLYSRL